MVSSAKNIAPVVTIRSKIEDRQRACQAVLRRRAPGSIFTLKPVHSVTKTMVFCPLLAEMRAVFMLFVKIMQLVFLRSFSHYPHRWGTIFERTPISGGKAHSLINSLAPQTFI